jgi:hypothetical protein
MRRFEAERNPGADSLVAPAGHWRQSTGNARFAAGDDIMRRF